MEMGELFASLGRREEGKMGEGERNISRKLMVNVCFLTILFDANFMV
jgi:hypothetical protein